MRWRSTVFHADRANAINLAQSIRLNLDDIEHFFPECLDHLAGVGRVSDPMSIPLQTLRENLSLNRRSPAPSMGGRRFDLGG